MPLAHEWAVTFGRLAANHLWQSTGFAAVAVVLALALRANSARARYGLWLAASVKFLIPFSVLAAIGGQLGRWLVPATPVARVPLAIEEIVQPFAPLQGAGLPAAVAVPAPAGAGLLPVVLLAIWLCGLVAVALHWWVRWRRVAAAVRSSTPMREGREVEALRRLRWGGRSFSVVCQLGSSKALTGHKKRWPVPLWGLLAPQSITLVSSTARLEPGVFGIFRPVLWLPAGIGDRLDDAELEAILAHELCHARRRDNLAAAIHMAVEALFWFHPLVWWLGARLTEERERACDEEVVRMGGEPQVYAESILKVCEFYLASPVACAAGVTGGGLKKRIESIMANRIFHKLNLAQRLLLAMATAGAVGGPIAAGLVATPRSQSQAQALAAVPQAPAANVQAAATAPPAGANTPKSEGRAMAVSQTGRAVQPVAALPALDGEREPTEVHHQQAEPPTFEVASVRRSGEESPIGAQWNWGTSPGSVELPRVTLQVLLMRIYHVDAYRIKGPSWLAQDEFDIAAKVPAGASKEQIPEMFESLLGERFGMVVHRETQVSPVYAIVVGKGGVRVKESSPVLPATWPPGLKPGESLTKIGPHGLYGVTGQITMNALAGLLSRPLHLPVVDLTDLKGTYDIDITWMPEPVQQPLRTSADGLEPGGLPEPSLPAPSIASELKDRLGLTLESRKMPIETLVIDNINRVPTDN